MTKSPDLLRRGEARLAWLLIVPALLTIGSVALFPIGWTTWESLHLHDLRMPWLGRPFVGWDNYLEVLSDRRFLLALMHTAAFVAITVPLELGIGLVVALALDRAVAARHIVRTAVLLPWSIPTVVAALVWRFMFESPGGIANAGMAAVGAATPTWFADPIAAWLPIVAADVWKATPFVVLLLVAGLQNIDRSLYEAARVDGAGAWRTLVDITLPLLAPAVLVAFLFRALDAFRVFDIIYVMTGGGPGTATEPMALYTFTTLLQNLRFGYGAALSIVVFAVAFAFALATIRTMGRSVVGSNP
jgi:ABC-type sugar transport system permease subunit